jgi:5-methylcytosine-specific restriction endonuclease McrA
VTEAERVQAIVCSKCKASKPASTDYFYFKHSLGKWSNWCKTCSGISQKIYSSQDHIRKRKNEAAIRWNRENKEKRFRIIKKHYYSNRENILRRGRGRTYSRLGIKNNDGSQFTTDNYESAFRTQSGKCAICGRHQDELGHTLNADHSHTTKIFRGLLCNQCNQGIGLLGDDKKRVLEVFLYLKFDGPKGYPK